MDHFGIGSGVHGAAAVYMCSARRTGRTTSLLESLKPGDRVCYSTQEAARELERRIRERRLEGVTVIVRDPQRAPDIFTRSGPSKGRTLFDHSWVEQYYLRAIEQCMRDIDHLQRESSGFGTPHIETRLQADELSRWRS
jgi:hypothetical protein